MSRVHCLLVGQGLAGSLLAYELILRGQRVMVIDDGGHNASKVAGGLVNPVTGKHWVKVAGVDDCLPAALRRYGQLARQFGQQFYIAKPMLRLPRTEAEARQAERRLASAPYRAYLGQRLPAQALAPLSAPLGAVRQLQTGHLLTRPLLACLQGFLVAHGSYLRARFDHQELALAPRPQWRDISADWVVFCEGHHARHNPWFSWLPFQAAKGEILDLRLPAGLAPDALLNYGHWLLPLSATEFRLGATFDSQNLDTRPTAAARERLMAGLGRWPQLQAAATVVGQQAGIRPSTRHKLPFVGVHPARPGLAMFNGFGAKGGLLIPWHSQRFADFLAGRAPPPADLGRYWRRG